MKIKNLKINKNVKKASTYILIGTLAFAGTNVFCRFFRPTSAPEYSIEKLIATNDDNNITITKDVDIYSPDLSSKDVRYTPENKIVEYNSWKKKDDHFEREINIYETDLEKEAITEILKSKVSTDKFIDKTSSIVEKVEELPDDNIYKEAYFYEYKDNRKLNDNEKRRINRYINVASTLAGIYLSITMTRSIELEKKEKTKVK